MIDFDFKVIYYRHNKYLPAPKISRMQIFFNELTLVISGTITYRINGTDVTLKSGDAVMLPVGSFRERAKPEKQLDYVSFNFTGGSRNDLPLVMRGVITNEIKLLVLSLDEVNRGRAFFEESFSSTVLSGILHLLRLNLDKKNENPTVRAIETYLLENYKNKITLGDIANLTYFSAAYCDELFKKEKGKYIIDYLLDIRINEAKNLLVEGVLPLSDISEKTGFGDYNYFSRLFKKRSGYSPKTYRNMVIKN